jgi:hypothetical protein
MAKVLMLLDVEEDLMKEQSGQDNLSDALNTEMGFVKESGIFVLDWIKLDAVNKEVLRNNSIWYSNLKNKYNL